MKLRTLSVGLVAPLLLGAGAAMASGIVRCKSPSGDVTYQVAPCPERAEQADPRIATDYPSPNRFESQRIFDREAALDRRLEARRDRELQEAQMREARAEREAERERLALIAAQAAQPQYVIAFPVAAYRTWAPGHRRSAAPGATRNGPIYR